MLLNVMIESLGELLCKTVTIVVPLNFLLVYNLYFSHIIIIIIIRFPGGGGGKNTLRGSNPPPP